VVSAFVKDIFREIKNTMGRFISLFIIVALGAASIVGIQATSINMRAAADKMYKAHMLYDLQIKSTVGFDDGDIDALRETDGVRIVMPTYMRDVFIDFGGGTNSTARAFALPDTLNTLTVTDGRLPENAGEVVVERGVLRAGGLRIGDTLTLMLENMDDYYNTFDDSEFTIVGVVNSPFYISFERGNTTLGDGSLRFFLYLHPDAFTLDVYTDVYVLMQGSHEMDNLTEDYYIAADGWRDSIQLTGNARIKIWEERFHGMISPEWFCFTRKDGIAYDSYYQDTLRLQQIGYVFPLVFFLVAIMVSVTTQARMVEEQRTQIGIYKALGYRPFAIMQKYLVYSLTASLGGSISGVFAGSAVFPIIIADAYGHLYRMPPIETPVPALIGVAAVLISTLSVVIVTILTCMNSMLGVPAELMRPKPPPAGRRVLLEHVPFIWHRFSFIGKVTARNIFRYKKRFLMTLVGIAACSSLLITAFGLRDGVGGVADAQFEKVIRYDLRAYTRTLTQDSQRQGLEELLPETHMFIRDESVDAKGTVNGEGLPATVMIAESPEKLGEYINLSVRQTGEPVPMTDNSVLVTEKLARVMDVDIGGEFTMTDADGRTYTAVVTGIVENYVLHFVYMSPGIYSAIFNKEYYPNGVLALTDNASELAEKLLGDSNVRAVIQMEEQTNSLRNEVAAMDVVTVVLIVLACALAFIVLFNLTNINITERIRELATIKVLGFYIGEVSMYVYRENAAVTVMGIILGLFGGIYLHSYVLQSAEVDLLMFPRDIHPLSYIYAAVLSVVFSIFVNLVMNIKLARIDMVESLKNVE
jgi:putative ABC transport system permease protein